MASARRAWAIRPAAEQPLEREAAAGFADRVGDRGDLLGAQRSADRPQVGLLGLDLIDPAALLQADKDLGDHQRPKATKADLPANPDRRLGLLPPRLVQSQPTRLGGSPGGTQPLLMRLAVDPIGMAALPWAGSHPAPIQGRKRNRCRMGEELHDLAAQGYRPGSRQRRLVCWMRQG